MPVVFTDHAKYPNIADVTGDFVYARLQRGKDTVPTAYPPKEIDAWAGRLQAWAQGAAPDDLPHIEAAKRQRPRRATSTLTSSTKAKCVRRRRRWR